MYIDDDSRLSKNKEIDSTFTVDDSYYDNRFKSDVFQTYIVNINANECKLRFKQNQDNIETEHRYLQQDVLDTLENKLVVEPTTILSVLRQIRHVLEESEKLNLNFRILQNEQSKKDFFTVLQENNKEESDKLKSMIYEAKLFLLAPSENKHDFNLCHTEFKNDRSKKVKIQIQENGQWLQLYTQNSSGAMSSHFNLLGGRFSKINNELDSFVHFCKQFIRDVHKNENSSQYAENGDFDLSIIWKVFNQYLDISKGFKNYTLDQLLDIFDERYDSIIEDVFDAKYDAGNIEDDEKQIEFSDRAKLNYLDFSTLKGDMEHVSGGNYRSNTDYDFLNTPKENITYNLNAFFSLSEKEESDYKQYEHKINYRNLNIVKGQLLHVIRNALSGVFTKQEKVRGSERFNQDITFAFSARNNSTLNKSSKSDLDVSSIKVEDVEDSAAAPDTSKGPDASTPKKNRSLLDTSYDGSNPNANVSLYDYKVTDKNNRESSISLLFLNNIQHLLLNNSYKNSIPIKDEEIERLQDVKQKQFSDIRDIIYSLDVPTKTEDIFYEINLYLNSYRVNSRGRNHPGRNPKDVLYDSLKTFLITHEIGLDQNEIEQRQKGIDDIFQLATLIKETSKSIEILKKNKEKYERFERINKDIMQSLKKLLQKRILFPVPEDITYKFINNCLKEIKKYFDASQVYTLVNGSLNTTTFFDEICIDFSSSLHSYTFGSELSYNIESIILGIKLLNTLFHFSKHEKSTQQDTSTTSSIITTNFSRGRSLSESDLSSTRDDNSKSRSSIRQRQKRDTVKKITPKDIGYAFQSLFKGFHYSNLESGRSTVLAFTFGSTSDELKKYLENKRLYGERFAVLTKFHYSSTTPTKPKPIGQVLEALFRHNETNHSMGEQPMAARVPVRVKGPHENDRITPCFVDGYMYRTDEFRIVETKLVNFLKTNLQNNLVPSSASKRGLWVSMKNRPENTWTVEKILDVLGPKSVFIVTDLMIKIQKENAISANTKSRRSNVSINSLISEIKNSLNILLYHTTK